MASRKAPNEALMMSMMAASLEQELIAQNHRLINIEGEIPEVIDKMTVPYECSVCGGKVMLEHAAVLRLNFIVGCPYCYEMRFVDDGNEHPPQWAR